MEKKKVIMKIESFSHKDGTLLLSTSYLGVRASLKSLIELCENKHGGFVQLEMSAPYPKRTTGRGSQNSHIWGHIQQIANFTGYDIDDVEDYAKLKAVSLGYPYKTNPLTGEIKPASMKTINTVEAGYLIETLHRLASELEIELDEGV